jgi:hypothetical protein
MFFLVIKIPRMPRKKIINEKNSKKKIFRLAIIERINFYFKKTFFKL